MSHVEPLEQEEPLSPQSCIAKRHHSTAFKSEQTSPSVVFSPSKKRRTIDANPEDIAESHSPGSNDAQMVESVDLTNQAKLESTRYPFKRISNDKLCFFDIPQELQDRVYLYYYAGNIHNIYNVYIGRGTASVRDWSFFLRSQHRSLVLAHKRIKQAVVLMHQKASATISARLTKTDLQALHMFLKYPPVTHALSVLQKVVIVDFGYCWNDLGYTIDDFKQACFIVCQFSQRLPNLRRVSIERQRSLLMFLDMNSTKPSLEWSKAQDMVSFRQGQLDKNYWLKETLHYLQVYDCIKLLHKVGRHDIELAVASRVEFMGPYPNDSIYFVSVIHL